VAAPSSRPPAAAGDPTGARIVFDLGAIESYES
jgi:hypothetical protein